MFSKKRLASFTVIASTVLTMNCVAFAADPPIAPAYPSPPSATPALPTLADGRIPGLVKQTATLSDGVSHTWYIYVPKSYNATKAVPLVLSLHGGGANGLWAASKTSWAAIADREGLIVAYPEATSTVYSPAKGTMSGSWNAFNASPGTGDDLAYLKALINKLCTDYAIDKGRIYMQGTSNGNQMTLYFAATYPKMLAAAAGFSGPTLTSSVKDAKGSLLVPSVPLPWYQWHGEYDTSAPGGTHQLLDDQTRDYWVSANKTAKVPEIRITGRYTTEVYNGYAEFRFTELTGGIHSVDFSAEDIAWNDLFSKYARDANGNLVLLKKDIGNVFSNKDRMTADPNSVAFVIGSSKALLGGKRIINLSRAPQEAYADKTLVPLDFFAKAFGAMVNYDSTTKKAWIRYGNKYGQLTMDYPLLTVNGEVIKQIDFMNPTLVNGVPMVPLRPIAENVLGKVVSYSSGAVYVSDSPYVQIDVQTAHVLGKILN